MARDDDPIDRGDWLERTFEEAPALIGIHRGPEFTFVFVNRAFREASDGRPLLGRPYADAFPEFVAQGYLDLFEGVFRTGEPFIARGARADTPRVRGGEPEERYWNVTFQPTRGASGAIDGLISFAFEVTDQILATRRAEAASQRYDDLVSAIGVMVWSIRKEGWAPLWVGGRVEAVLGVSPQEALRPESWWEGLHPEDRPRVEAARSGLVEAGDRYEVEYRVVDGSGAPRWLAESGRLEAHTGAAVVWGLTQDVSARVEIQQQKELQQAQMLHVQKLESLGLLAGGVAHDFNNLLTAILGQASLASIHLGSSPQGQRAIASIVAASTRASDLTRQLLAYSGRGRSRVESVELNGRIRELSRLLEASIPKKVALRSDLAPLPLVVQGDVSQLDQVLMNLVINAAEAIGDASGVVMICTGLRTLGAREIAGATAFREARPGRFAYVEVADTGSGMDAATLSRMFDPFFTTKATGRGLGLAAVQGIVQAHGGLIEVHSEVGRGTTFSVLLPAARVAAPQPPRPVPEAPRARSNALILVVDDEPAIRESARAALEGQGYRVVEAADGVEALDVFRGSSEPIALVLLDLTMPRMGGEEALAQMRLLRPGVPVLLASGYDADGAARRVAGLDGVDFLQKPYTVQRLLDAVRRRVDRTDAT